MTESALKLSEIKEALKREELNFKIKNTELNGAEDSITFIDGYTKTKVRGKVIRSFNEGEMYHWPSLNHENVARLIEILPIRKSLYIYLTVDDEVTLKNLVHEENFLYDPRCFDRKRFYAKGIFDGLSYLHGKALCLMNLCDDNIIICKADDRAIITNFDSLTYSHRTTRSKLNVPEMYMAPETEKGEFDAVKAEIWASGILMLDMFLAHMVPWAIINYTPKKVIQIVDKMSLDLLQAANVGSVVTSIDLAKFQTFLRCFFKQKPLDRIPAKYASIASFLKSRPDFPIFGNRYQSDAFTEDMLPVEYSDLNLPKEQSTICLNPSYDPYSSCMSPTEQETHITSTDAADVVASNEIQQAKRSEKIVENDKQIDTSLKEVSEINTSFQRENLTKTPSLPSYKTAEPIREKITDNIQKNPLTSEVVNKDIKTVNESINNCYLSKSLSFTHLNEGTDHKVAFELISKSHYSYSNGKLSPTRKQFVGNDALNKSFCLNLLFDNSSVSQLANNQDNIKSDNNNSVEKSDCMNVVTCEKVSEIFQTRHLMSESQIKENKPAKPPRFSKASLILNIPPEIQLAINKLIFLGKCYISILVHQRVFISHEFASRQQKFINEYQFLLKQEDRRLREMLRRRYELTFDDITKLIRFLTSRALPGRNQHENLLMDETFYKINRNKCLQTRETENSLKVCMDSAKYFCPCDTFMDPDTVIVKPDRNYSYYKAIEKSVKNLERKWNINDRLDCEKPKKEWEKTKHISKTIYELDEELKDWERNCEERIKKEGIRTKFDLENNHPPDSGKPMTKWKRNTLVPQNNGNLVGEQSKKEWVKTKFAPEYKLNKRVNVATKVEEKKFDGKTSIITTKQYGQTENRVQTDYREKNFTGARPKKTEKRDGKSNKKGSKDGRKEKVKKDSKKPGKDKDKKKIDKKEKKLHTLKKLEEPKSSWFSVLCPGGKVENRTPIADSLCETCKLNLEIIQ